MDDVIQYSHELPSSFELSPPPSPNYVPPSGVVVLMDARERKRGRRGGKGRRIGKGKRRREGEGYGEGGGGERKRVKEGEGGEGKKNGRGKDVRRKVIGSRRG